MSFYHWGKSRALRILGKPCSLFNFISNINNNDDDDINNDNDKNDNNNNNNNNSNNSSDNNNNNKNPVTLKFRTDIWRGIAMSHGQVKRSSGLVGNHLEMVS